MNMNWPAVDQEVERSSTNWKIGGLIPGSSSPHVDAAVAMATVYECVSWWAALCVEAPSVCEWDEE